MIRNSRSQTRRKNAVVTGGGFSFLIFSPMLLFFFMLWLLSNEGSISFSTSGQPQHEIAPLFTAEVQAWQPEISNWAEKYGLDANLIATVMQIESCGDPRAQSPAGARGLFQVMPFHFATTELPLNPNTNARRGLQYLKSNLRNFGNVSLALAAYNGGPGNAINARWQWPDETQRYVYWGEGIYEDAAQWQTHSDRLDEWLSAGGASLCQQAKEELGFP